MKKTRSNKGFTLAELLIVVAIIAVLVAVAIPVFNAQLEKSREATDIANLRSAYAEAVAAFLDGDSSFSGTPYNIQQRTASWTTSPSLDPALMSASGLSTLQQATSGTFTVTYSTSGSTAVTTITVTGGGD